MESTSDLDKVTLEFYKPDNFPKGLTRKVVESISHIKNEPSWLAEFRLKAFEVYEQKPMPTWGFIPQFHINIDDYTLRRFQPKKEKILGRSGSRNPT